MKKAFTLAEIMIVLTIIGILTAILLPIANHSRPDENVMKFKKADTTLKNVIKELVNSGEYFEEGDLGKLKSGELVGKEKRSILCEAFADMVSAKKKNCDYTTTQTTGCLQYCSYEGSVYETTCTISNTDEERATALDNRCKQAEVAFGNGDLGVLTSDNVYYFEENLLNPFGCVIQGNENEVCDAFPTSASAWAKGRRMHTGDLTGIVQITNGVKTYRWQKVFCIDIDGINKGEDPFGYGIRVDGRIIMGKRADEWLEKGFQKGSNEN